MKRMLTSRVLRALAGLALSAMLIASAAACSSETPVELVSPSPTASATAPPTPEPTPDPTPTPAPTVSLTPAPTPVVSFPPLATDSAGKTAYPQVVADKESALTNEPVNFKIVTSKDVSKIQTVIDGDTGKIYTDYEQDSDLRVWLATVYFTVGGNRKVQFKCTMASGGTAVVPKSPVLVDVSFKYTAESTSRTITKGKTVIFTLKTPDLISSVYVVVDGVNQKVQYSEPSSNEGGVKIWKLNVTFFGLGERKVTFEAYKGSKLQASFPDPGITIIVQDS